MSKFNISKAIKSLQENHPRCLRLTISISTSIKKAITTLSACNLKVHNRHHNLLRVKLNRVWAHQSCLDLQKHLLLSQTYPICLPWTNLSHSQTLQNSNRSLTSTQVCNQLVQTTQAKIDTQSFNNQLLEHPSNLSLPAVTLISNPIANSSRLSILPQTLVDIRKLPWVQEPDLLPPETARPTSLSTCVLARITKISQEGFNTNFQVLSQASKIWTTLRAWIPLLLRIHQFTSQKNLKMPYKLWMSGSHSWNSIHSCQQNSTMSD